MAKTFDDWFRSFNSWDLSLDDLLRLSMTPGVDTGDVVWTNVHGQAMTRYVCSKWIAFYGSALAGWNARGDEQGISGGSDVKTS